MKNVFFASNFHVYSIPNKLYNELLDCESHYEMSSGYDETKWNRALEIREEIMSKHKLVCIVNHCVTGDLQ